MLFSTELESIYDPLEKNMNVTSQLEHKYSAFKILSFWHILSTNGSTGLHRGSKSVINLHQSLSLHPSAPAFVSNSLHRTDRNLTMRQRQKSLLLAIPETEPQQWSSHLAATSMLWSCIATAPVRITRSMSCAHLSLPPHPVQIWPFLWSFSPG